MDKYRFESGSAYEYVPELQVYMFIGKLNGATTKEFIEEYELEQNHEKI